MAIGKLLFIDTSIWLDFYRARNEISLQLLGEIEKISDKIIVNYQLEGEFKRNRQTAILEGMQELKPPANIPRLGIFSDAKASDKVAKRIKEVERSVKVLRTRLGRVLADPSLHDPVYQAFQRLLHKTDDLVLSRENKIKNTIRRRAFKRFLHGCPPRKKNDTSIGDAINWEWMIHCAVARKAELVIVSRDSDYGVTFGEQSFINDHLRQEFSERVSQKRKILLYTKLSDALKHFKVPVSSEIKKAETDLVESTRLLEAAPGSSAQWLVPKGIDWEELKKQLEEYVNAIQAIRAHTKKE